ncbi:MAG TPA: peptidylprolyl isomerase [Thermoanaerobaculia bacterium]|nr:peptidylprolyl isomerase [Thermoanaerobaculia bacterium]
MILAVLVSVAKRESPTPHHAPERASERAEVSLPPSSEVSSEQAFDGNGRQKVADQNDVTVRGVEGAEQRPEASNEPKIAVLHTTAGQIGIRFFPEKAPKHVRNFIALAEAGFYDGTKFHRIIPGFMIQGGDPNTISGDTSTWGTGGSGKLVPAEFNDVYHRRGIVSMARAQDPNGASSQFFICVAEARFLDRKYSVFGEVVDGMEVVDTIVRAPRDRSDRPNAPTTIERITMRDAKDYSAVTETSTGQENHVSERRTERASDVSTIGSATAQDEPPSNGGDTLAEEGRTTPARVDAGTVASSTMKGSPPAMPIAPSARQSTEVASPNDASVESLSAVGHWRGNVKQFLAPRYSVVLSLAHGKIGTYVGTIEYPEVNCSGDLTLLDAAPGQVRISEIITSGRCVSGGTIVISNIRSNTAEWAWYNKNGRRQATSHITRLESGERR